MKNPGGRCEKFECHLCHAKPHRYKEDPSGRGLECYVYHYPGCVYGTMFVNEGCWHCVHSRAGNGCALTGY